MSTASDTFSCLRGEGQSRADTGSFACNDNRSPWRCDVGLAPTARQSTRHTLANFGPWSARSDPVAPSPFAVGRSLGGDFPPRFVVELGQELIRIPLDFVASSKSRHIAFRSVRRSVFAPQNGWRRACAGSRHTLGCSSNDSAARRRGVPPVAVPGSTAAGTAAPCLPESHSCLTRDRSCVAGSCRRC